jgi:hypothetical protein
MRVHLKGIHSVTTKLAGGESATYHYAWRGGPRLVGEPGSPEFLASYTAAHSSRRQPDAALFHSVIAGYKASEDFRGLQPRTKSDYLKLIAKIEKAFGSCRLMRSKTRASPKTFWNGGTAWRRARAKPITPGPCSSGCCPGQERGE